MRFSRSKSAKMRENGLARELKQIRRSYLRRGAGMAAVGSLIFICIGASADGFMRMGLFAAAAWCWFCLKGALMEVTRQRKYRQVASGLSGENKVFQVLAGIDPHFIVCNQVLLPNPHSRTGHTEADFVVIGRKALYLVETKNNEGQITAIENASNWPITVALRDGSERFRTMRNPVRQVKIQEKVLRQRLAEKGHNPIIQPTVAFSNPDADIYEQGEISVPIFTYPLANLASRIKAYEERLSSWPDIDREKIKASLDALHEEALRVSRVITR